MIGRGRRGLGQMSCPPGQTVDANGFCAASGSSPYSAPWYCSLPGIELTQGCIRANDLANLGPAVTPANVAALQQQWTQTEAQQCAADPQGCSDLQAVQKALRGDPSGLLPSSTSIWLLVAVAAIVLLAVKR